MQEGNSNPPSEENTPPQYVEDFSTVFTKQGLKFIYKPVFLKPLPPVEKPYTIYEKDFPDSWIQNEFKWHNNKSSPGIFNGKYLLETVFVKKSKSSPERTIFRLYKLKWNSKNLPKVITNSDFELVTTLDKAGEGPFPQNLIPEVSQRFVVWSASADEMTLRWSIWAYDILRNETFCVYSYKDAEKEFEPMRIPEYNIIPEKNFLLIDLTGNGKKGSPLNKEIFYDLVNRKILKEIDDSIYKRQYTFMWAPPLHSIDDYLYGELFYLDYDKNYDKNFSGQYPGPYILSDIIRINLNTFTEETVFQKNPFRILALSHSGKIALTPYVKSYPFHDIWIWDTKENTMRCYLKVSLEGSITPLDDMKPYVSFLEPAGFLYAGGGDLSEEHHTFFSFKENKAYYTTPRFLELEFGDTGEFAIYKSPYDLLPLPPFDYPGKEDRLKGYETFLIIKPE